MILDNEEEIQGVKFSEFPSEPPASADEVVGLHSGGNARFSVANIVLLVRQGLANIFVPNTRKVNNKTLDSDITLTAADVGAGTYTKPSGGIPASDLASGVIPSVPSAYTSNPAMDGASNPGSSDSWAKGDHVHPSDSAKVNQSQLATVESGSTVSQPYSIGEYFVNNGVLYRAAASISAGEAVTPGTNCEEVAVGSLLFNRFNLSATAPKTLTFTANSRGLLIVTSSSSTGMGIYGLESSSGNAPAAAAMFLASALSIAASGGDLNLTTSTGCSCALFVFSGSIKVSNT